MAGVVPGCRRRSAGQVESATTHPGNRHLKAALGVAALSAARSKNTYYSARYRRIAGRRRPVQSRQNTSRGSSVAGMIALVALEHTMLTDAWHMLVNGAFYHNPGPDYYTRYQPRENQGQSHQATRNPRLQGHTRTTHRSCLTPDATHSPAAGHLIFE